MTEQIGLVSQAALLYSGEKTSEPQVYGTEFVRRTKCRRLVYNKSGSPILGPLHVSKSGFVSTLCRPRRKWLWYQGSRLNFKHLFRSLTLGSKRSAVTAEIQASRGVWISVYDFVLHIHRVSVVSGSS